MRKFFSVIADALIEHALPTAINGAIVYAITDAGFLACAFAGGVLSIVFQSSARTHDLRQDLDFTRRELQQASEHIERLQSDLWILRDRLADVAGIVETER